MSKPVGRFSIGMGGDAHAPNEWLLIESSDPKVAGASSTSTMGYVEFLYTFAAMK